MISSELVKKVKDYFSLNIYETKVWLALISKGIASAGEIAEISGVPRSRTYDVLESLEKQGFAMIKIGKPVKYIAVKPEVVIEKLKNNTLKNAEDKVDVLSKMKETEEYKQLQQLHNSSLKPIKHGELSGSLRGKGNIISHIKEILENARKEVIICTTALELQEKSRIYSTVFERLNSAGIRMRIALSGTDEEIKRVNSRFNIKAKKIDLKSKFYIADRESILFMLNDSNEEEFAIWLNSEFLASSLAYMSELAFK